VWIKLWEDVLDCRKLQELSATDFRYAINLWVASKRTDGTIRPGDIREVAWRLRMSPRKLTMLLDRFAAPLPGLVDEIEPGVYRVHDWEDWQGKPTDTPTAISSKPKPAERLTPDELERQRERNRERQRRRRMSQRHTPESVTGGVTSGVTGSVTGSVTGVTCHTPSPHTPLPCHRNTEGQNNTPLPPSGVTTVTPSVTTSVTSQGESASKRPSNTVTEGPLEATFLERCEEQLKRLPDRRKLHLGLTLIQQRYTPRITDPDGFVRLLQQRVDEWFPVFQAYREAGKTRYIPPAGSFVENGYIDQAPLVTPEQVADGKVDDWTARAMKEIA
jgi:hypothetical protein